MPSMRYRVSYGNGQCSNTYKSLRDAQREIADAKLRNESHTANFRVQFQDPETGDWFTHRSSSHVK